MMLAWLKKCLCSKVHWHAEYEVSVKYKGANHWPTDVCSGRHTASLQWGMCKQPGCLQHTGVKIKNYQKKRRSKFLRSPARRRTDLSSPPECGGQQRCVNVCADTLWERHNMKCCSLQALGEGTSLRITEWGQITLYCSSNHDRNHRWVIVLWGVMYHTEEMMCLSCVTCSLSLSSTQAKF